MATRRLGRSYEYKALCDVCKFEYYNYELRQRWDGAMCCPKDWEPRHPMDFYRPKNDTHKLPFIRSDSSDKNYSWTPVYSNLTVTLATGETQSNNDGSYSFDTLSTIPTTSGIATIDFLKNQVAQNDANSVTSSNGTTTTMTLPTTTGGTGTCRILTREAKYLGGASIAAGASTVTFPAWTARGGLIISFTYVT
jgi:hypothetical protein